MTIRAGIDVLLRTRLDELQDLRVGLVTNNVATTMAPQANGDVLTPTRSALLDASVNLVVLFSPEHGMSAAAADGAAISNDIDRLTGMPIVSLYGETLRPGQEALEKIDLLLFDIPDIGARFYTYIWTLSHVMAACADAGLPLWILDRPNPLGGDLAAAEGPMLDEAVLSTFVGRWSMPIRHSLTVGELAHYWNQSRNLGVDLEIVPVEGWQRGQQWPDTGLPFLPPSPNMANFEAALLYPGACLFEGTNLSEGRGTGNAFQQCGAPWLDHIAVANCFNEIGLPGVRARAVEFTPCGGKYADQACNGVMLHVLDRFGLRPVSAGLHLMNCIRSRHPQEFSWLPYPTSANATGHGHFDRLIGQVDVRLQFESDATIGSAAIERWTACEHWTARVQPYLFYSYASG